MASFSEVPIKYICLELLKTDNDILMRGWCNYVKETITLYFNPHALFPVN